MVELIFRDRGIDRSGGRTIGMENLCIRPGLLRELKVLILPFDAIFSLESCLVFLHLFILLSKLEFLLLLLWLLEELSRVVVSVPSLSSNVVALEELLSSSGSHANA